MFVWGVKFKRPRLCKVSKLSLAEKCLSGLFAIIDRNRSSTLTLFQVKNAESCCTLLGTGHLYLESGKSGRVNDFCAGNRGRGHINLYMLLHIIEIKGGEWVRGGSAKMCFILRGESGEVEHSHPNLHQSPAPSR